MTRSCEPLGSHKEILTHMNTNSKLLTLVALFALAAMPFAQGYGEQVLDDSTEFTPDVVDDLGSIDTITAERFDAGTPDDNFDDVIVLNVDGTVGADQYDLVVASNGYDGTEVGGLVDDSMDQVDGLGDVSFVATE